MHYLIYKTTNNINGKIYIGCHATKNINDNYLGSGILLKRAIQKYGIENFTKEILECFDNPIDMFNMEVVLVNETFIIDENTYNVMIGGHGGWKTINNNLTQKERKENRLVFKNRYNTKTITDEERLDKRKEIGRKNFVNKRGMFDPKYIGTNKSYFFGKKHTEETKQKIGKANAKKQKGEKNSQYGTCWVYSLDKKINLKIKKDELNSFLVKGWLKGRKMNF